MGQVFTTGDFSQTADLLAGFIKRFPDADRTKIAPGTGESAKTG
jgi:hypothetical protein